MVGVVCVILVNMELNLSPVFYTQVIRTWALWCALIGLVITCVNIPPLLLGKSPGGWDMYSLLSQAVLTICVGVADITTSNEFRNLLGCIPGVVDCLAKSVLLQI